MGTLLRNHNNYTVSRVNNQNIRSCISSTYPQYRTTLYYPKPLSHSSSLLSSYYHPSYVYTLQNTYPYFNSTIYGIEAKSPPRIDLILIATLILVALDLLFLR